MAQLKSTTVSGSLKVAGQTEAEELDITNSAKVGATLELGAHIIKNEGTNFAVGVSDLLNLLYPVGSIYMSTYQNPETVNTPNKFGCPLADTIGGKWVRFAEGRSPVGYGSTTDQNDETITVNTSDIGIGWGRRSTPLFNHTHTCTVTQPSIKEHEGSFTLEGRRLEGNQSIVTFKEGSGGFTHKWGEHAPEVAAIDYHHKHWLYTETITFKHTHEIKDDGSVTVNGINTTEDQVTTWEKANGRNWQPSIGVFMWKRAE